MTDLSSRPAVLATELLRWGARFAVVGSTARWLTTGAGTPRDLDVAVCRDDLSALAAALARLGVTTTPDRLGRAEQSYFGTAWGPLDVFVVDKVSSCEVTAERAGRTWWLPVVTA